MLPRLATFSQWLATPYPCGKAPRTSICSLQTALSICVYAGQPLVSAPISLPCHFRACKSQKLCWLLTSTLVGKTLSCTQCIFTHFPHAYPHGKSGSLLEWAETHLHASKLIRNCIFNSIRLLKFPLWFKPQVAVDYIHSLWGVCSCFPWKETMPKQQTNRWVASKEVANKKSNYWVRNVPK